MSLKSIFGAALSKLRNRKWEPEDIDRLAEELFDAFSSQGPIVLSGPVEVHNPTAGPALTIVNTAGIENPEGIEISDAQGRKVKIGIGLATRGVFASNFVYDEAFKSDPRAVTEAYGKNGQGGTVELAPGEVGPALGVVYSNKKQQEVASGFSYSDSGSGVPDVPDRGADNKPWEPLAGVGEMLGSIIASEDSDTAVEGCHPPDSAYISDLNGDTVYFISNLNGWAINRCKVLEINADTLMCQQDITGELVVVAKPYSLQRTPFDLKTINGVYYEYLTNQTRTAANATARETQEISPSYDGSTGYSPGNIVYVRWVSNGTDIEGVNYIDVNADARAWVSSTSSAYVGDDGIVPEIPVSGDDGLTQMPDGEEDFDFIETGPGVPPGPDPGTEGIGTPGIGLS